MPLTKNEVRKYIPKLSRDWNELEKGKTSLNSKVMNALFSALHKKEFHRVSSCESANESHLINRLSTAVIRDKTPMKVWYGKPANDYDFTCIRLHC